MSSPPTRFKSIALEFLYEGMVLAEDIYNYDGRLLLLAKGNELTKNRIQQLWEYNANNHNISVFESTYNSLLARGFAEGNILAQNYLEEKVGYSEIKDSTSDLLLEIKNTDSVSKDAADRIAAGMSDKVREINPSLIFQCINAPNPIDEYLRRHSINVGLINGLMGKWLNLPDDEVDLLVLAGLVHDVGKTKIPTEILDAPRRLSLSEFEVMKMHTIYSYELLEKDEQFSMPVKLTARHHHEKMNGSGYPDGISADKISLFARITAVGDIYDAMVSKRVYKEANNPFTIISNLAKQQFSELDTHLVRLFTEHMPSELIGKLVLLSDGTIGSIKFIVPNDLEHPLVDVNGSVKKTNEHFYCQRMIFEE